VVVVLVVVLGVILLVRRLRSKAGSETN
jgi:hypothetical protein